MIIADYVDDVDYVNDSITKSSPFNTLNVIVNDILVDYSWDDFYLTYLVKEPLFKRNVKVPLSLFNQTAKADISTLLGEIQEMQPKVIVLLGARVTSLIIGKKLKDVKNEVHNLPDWFNHECKVVALESIRTVNENDPIMPFIDGFVKAIELLDDLDSNPFKNKLIPYELVTTIDRFKETIDMCVEAGYFCHDYETDGGNYYDPKSIATCIGYAFQPGFSFILPIDHFESPFTFDEITEIYSILAERIFSNQDVIKIAHNLKYEMHWHTKYGINHYAGVYHDTMLMSHICDENTRNGLKELTARYFPQFEGYAISPGRDGWAAVPLKTLAVYNAIDVHVTFLLKIMFENELLRDDFDKESGVNNYYQYFLYRNLVMFAFKTLQRMEYRGAIIDRKLIEESIVEADKRLAEKHSHLMEFPQVNRFVRYKRQTLTDKAVAEMEEKKKKHEMSGKFSLARKYDEKIETLKNMGVDYTINFNSPSQLVELLYTDPMGFCYPQNPESEKPDTGKDYLHELDTDFTKLLLAYRSIGKMKSTYYEGILNSIDDMDRLHTSYNMHGTVTGRISSSNPNLQNIPARTQQDDEDVVWAIKSVKKFFKVPDAYVMIQFDFSQAELRLIANFSGDPTMKSVYLEGKDIHSMTGARIVGMDYDEFLKSPNFKRDRNDAKSANFGLVYDISIPGYIRYIKAATGKTISTETAKNHSDSLFGVYKKLRDWHAIYKAKAIKYGYVRTLFGRKRRLPDVYSKNSADASKAMRSAINAPIQGSGGEWTIFVMALLDCVLPSNVYFFNTVHDSFFLYCPKYLTGYVCQLVKKYAEQPPVQRYFKINDDKLSVPMKVDIEISEKSWGDMNPVDISKII